MSKAEDMIDEFLDTIPKPKTYEQLQQELHEEQDTMSREQVVQKLTSTNEAVFDPEKAVPETHHWVDRGEVMSCEGANHPNHRHFKVKRR